MAFSVGCLSGLIAWVHTSLFFLFCLMDKWGGGTGGFGMVDWVEKLVENGYGRGGIKMNTERVEKRTAKLTGGTCLAIWQMRNIRESYDVL